VINAHFIIKYFDGIEPLLNVMVLKCGVYKLISSQECAFSEKDFIVDPVYQGLKFDGESLMSKFKAQQKKTIHQPKK
jgi:hypothetical protein